MTLHLQKLWAEAQHPNNRCGPSLWYNLSHIHLQNRTTRSRWRNQQSVTEPQSDSGGFLFLQAILSFFFFKLSACLHSNQYQEGYFKNHELEEEGWCFLHRNRNLRKESEREKPEKRQDRRKQHHGSQGWKEGREGSGERVYMVQTGAGKMKIQRFLSQSHGSHQRLAPEQRKQRRHKADCCGSRNNNRSVDHFIQRHTQRAWFVCWEKASLKTGIPGIRRVIDRAKSQKMGSSGQV